ncbi:phosphatase 2C-like domain-containing protein [Lasiosphaeria ovina]|uniref:Protein phosphatase n=1 Tax=Lasiosphaeria ovina TaxID=92902 RepID=A0AAE0NLH1_9PEZI|nr:phosphatase 2C-like domain-containing protein [Lasiosphaeria ovina]
MASRPSTARALMLQCRPRPRLSRPAINFVRMSPAARAVSSLGSSPARPAGRQLGLLGYDLESRRQSSTTRAAQTALDPKFVYNVAASYISKGIPFDPSKHVFHFNPYNRVHPPKPGREKSARPESGQDAFFVSRVGSNPSEVALGVADGVGGWMDSGVDPADFSHAFCDYMATAAYECRPAGEGSAKPALSARQLMKKGYDAVCHDPAIKAGGSTAIVGLLNDKGTLEVANLGDSGYILLRLNGVHASSEPQTHAFNTPFQLSVVPPSMLLRAAAFGGARLMDQPRDAEVTRHNLRHGDVLIFASDGLWDNLFTQDILRIVSSTMANTGAWTTTDAGVQVASDLSPYTRLDTVKVPNMDTSASEKNGASKVGTQQRPIATLQSLLAMEIVGAAKAASLNSKLDGPFAKEVKKYYPFEVWRGGKEDDICAVVVLVSEEAKL